jgi:hypothetical protein
MKPLKLGLRLWIAFTTVMSFLMGWALLAHSAKPAPLTTTAGLGGSGSTSSGQLVLPALPPVPSLSDFTSGQPVQAQNLQPLSVQSLPSFGSSMPGLRTRGS